MAVTDYFLSGVNGSVQGAGGRVFEPQVSNAARLVIQLAGSGFGDNEDLTLSLQGFTLPQNASDVMTIPFNGEYRFFAGRTMFHGLNMTFHDYVDRKTLQTLWAWRMYIHNPTTGKKGRKSIYARNGSVDLWGPDGADGEVFTYILKGIWINNLDPGSIDYGSNDPVRINANFIVDKAYPDDSTTIGSDILNRAQNAGRARIV